MQVKINYNKNKTIPLTFIQHMTSLSNANVCFDNFVNKYNISSILPLHKTICSYVKCIVFMS